MTTNRFTAADKWTPEVYNELAALRVAGLSFAEIADALNKKYPGTGFTKNACLGIHYRKTNPNAKK